MHKAIREYLESKLQALKEAHSKAATGGDLPGRIVFWPPPKDALEAKLHGLLEGLYVAGKIKDREASDWHSRFRSALATPGDPGTAGYMVGPIPDDVRARYEPWLNDAMMTAIEPDIPAQHYDNGLLALTRVELYPLGLSLHWRLDLSKDAQTMIQQARRGLKESPPDLLEFHLTRTFLPSIEAMTMSDATATAFALLDMDSNFVGEDQIRALTRLTPRPELPAHVTVAWAGPTFAFSLDAPNSNAKG